MSRHTVIHVEEVPYGRRKSYRLSIGRLDEDGRGFGYRLSGPKAVGNYHGTERELINYKVTDADRDKILQHLGVPSKNEILSAVVAAGGSNKVWEAINDLFEQKAVE